MGCSETEEDTPTVFVKQTTQGYRLIQNGVPFLIKGAGGDIKYLKELKEAGANTVRIYDTLHLKIKLQVYQIHLLKVSKDGMLDTLYMISIFCVQPVLILQLVTNYF